MTTQDTTIQPSDEEIIEFWGDDYRPDDVVIFARALLAKYGAPVVQEPVKMPSDEGWPEPLDDFSEGQWWVKKLDEMKDLPGTTPDQKRAVAVVHHLLASVTCYGQLAQPAASAEPEFNGWYCSHCQRGVDASEVTYNEQHQACGRVITNDRPPAPVAAQPSVSSLVYLYNSGYMAGHNDTVEGQFTDILCADMSTYHEDVVREIMGDLSIITPPADASSSEEE